MLKFGTGIRFLSVFVTALLLVSSASLSADTVNQTLKEQYPIAEFNGITSDSSIKNYDDYLSENSSYSDTSGLSIDIPLTSNSLYRSENGEGFIEWDNNTKELSFSFTVGEALTEDIVMAKKFIDDNIYNVITTEQIARMSNLSVSRLKAKFCAQVGMAPIQYYNYKRLKEAKRLLENGVGITDTAYKLQFSSSSHFSNFFKKHTYMTPKQYKKECGKKTDDV